MNETLELLINDEIDNDSGMPKKGKGKATFEFQILPLKQGKVFIKKFYISTKMTLTDGAISNRLGSVPLLCNNYSRFI